MNAPGQTCGKSGKSRSRATPRLAFSSSILHCIALCARIHHHQAIEAKFCGTGCHLTMQVKAAVSELQHCSQHGEASTTGLGRQQLQCRHDRLRGSVVGLIQNGQPAKLEASVAASGHGHLHRLKLADAEPQVLGNRDRKQQIPGVVAPF